MNRRTLLRDERGMALIEFAFVLPILLLLYLGGAELCNAMSCSRKVTIAARATADLTSQYAVMTTSDVQTVLAAAGTIMTPFSAAGAMVRVSEIAVDANGNATIAWSQAINGTARAVGSAFIAPTGLLTPGTYLIVGEVSYAWQPVIANGTVPPITLGDTVYMSPRNSKMVALQ